MDLSFPEKYYEVAKYFDFYIGDLEQTPLLTDTQRLLFYALRQQAEHGPCTAEAPSMWYMTERHKHQAWKQLGRMSTFEAMVFFVQQFERVLWALEHPDADDKDAATKAKIDWPARLRELRPTAPAGEEAANAVDTNGAQQEKGQKDTVRLGPVPEATSVTSASASPPAEATKPISAPVAVAAAASAASTACIPPAEMEGWDNDIVAHASLSIENLRYLATALMQARQAAQRARGAPAAETDRQLDCAHAEALPVPVPPFAENGATALTAAPPLKPMWTIHGQTIRAPIIPPPVRFSARSLTEAAVRPPREAFTVKATAPTTAAAHQDTSSSWFGW